MPTGGNQARHQFFTCFRIILIQHISNKWIVPVFSRALIGYLISEQLFGSRHYAYWIQRARFSSFLRKKGTIWWWLSTAALACILKHLSTSTSVNNSGIVNVRFYVFIVVFSFLGRLYLDSSWQSLSQQSVTATFYML